MPDMVRRPHGVAHRTPLRIASRVLYTGTVKRADHTAELLFSLMRERGLSVDAERSTASLSRHRAGDSPSGTTRASLRVALARLPVATVFACAAVVCFGQTPLGAQPADVPVASLPFDGPPPPVPPEIISRDAAGRATIRAVRLTEPLEIDGNLDESVYREVRSASGFIQGEPDEGAPATNQTEVWVLFDDDNIYISVKCWESNPERMVANDMRRDGGGGNDRIGFSFDTFYDRRNAFTFSVTPIGGRLDGQITDERGYNADWNAVWDFATGRFDGGWTVETAIPFKSLRYRPGRAQLWGIQVMRRNQWKNEFSYLTPIPYGLRGLFQVSLAPTLVGLEVPPGSRNLEIKPFAVSDVKTDLLATPTISNALGVDIGADVKYGITQNLTADLTVNTDFAQVEADEQQVNLTRFSLFFPEKREFFLENQGTFAFGGAGTGPSGAVGGDTPILFYSRRIGLNEGRVVSIQVGGRLTGRVGTFSVGMLNIQTANEPAPGARATNFSVMRVKRDVLRRSSVGAIFTGRSVSTLSAGSNQTYGVDGTFAFYNHLSINTYWAKTRTGGLSGSDTSYLGQIDYEGDRYGARVEHLVVGDGFNPEVGFVRRDDIRRSFGELRFSPRPQSVASIRKISWTGSVAHTENNAGRLETRDWDGEFAIEFENSDRFLVAYADTYEFLPRPFSIAPDIIIPVGGYDFANVRTGFTFGTQRRWAGRVSAEHGSFFSGHKTGLTLSQGLVEISPQFSVEPSVSINWVDLAEGVFTTTLVGSRATYTMTPFSFVSAFLQYSSSANVVSANVRLRWEYQPGSELFVVYNDERNTRTRRFPDLQNRAFIVKINRLFRF